MALQKAGIEAVVVEAHPRDDGDIGSYFDRRAERARCARAPSTRSSRGRDGFADAPQRHARQRDGPVLGDLPLGAPLADGTPALTMKRSRLARRARRARPADGGSEIQSRPPLVAAKTDGDGVVATFATARTETADLLVGADGVHSVVRRIIDPAAPAVGTSA